MARSDLTLGTVKNDNTGEDLRDGGVKINTMMSDLYTLGRGDLGDPPDPTSALTEVNSQSSQLDRYNSNMAIFYKAPGVAVPGSLNLTLWVDTVSGDFDFQVYCPYVLNPNDNNGAVGICVYDSSGGEIITLWYQWDGALETEKYTNTTTFSSTYVSSTEFNEGATGFVQRPPFLRIVRVTNTVDFQFSWEGGWWQGLDTRTVGTDITAIDRVGFAMRTDAMASGTNMNCHVAGWSLTP